MKRYLIIPNWLINLMYNHEHKSWCKIIFFICYPILKKSNIKPIKNWYQEIGE